MNIKEFLNQNGRTILIAMAVVALGLLCLKLTLDYLDISSCIQNPCDSCKKYNEPYAECIDLCFKETYTGIPLNLSSLLES